MYLVTEPSCESEPIRRLHPRRITLMRGVLIIAILATSFCWTESLSANENDRLVVADRSSDQFSAASADLSRTFDGILAGSGVVGPVAQARQCFKLCRAD